MSRLPQIGDPEAAHLPDPRTASFLRDRFELARS